MAVSPINYKVNPFRIQASFWRCNLYDFQKGSFQGKNCAYCQIFSPMETQDTYVDFGSKRIPVTRELTPKEWIRGMHKVRLATSKRPLWDFTGGEPTLYEGLPELLEGARTYSDWAITSNSLLRRQIERIFNANIDMPSSWTSSWHPGAKRDINEFIDTLKFIRSHGVYTSCTVVLHASTKDTIREDLKRIASEGFVVQIHLALMEGYSLANDSDTELKAIYEELKWLNRAPAEDYDSTPEGVPTPRDCVAGYESVAVSSDGAIYPCYRGMMCEPNPPIGKWGEWIPQTDLTRGCDWICNFACDLRLVTNVSEKLWKGAAAQV